MIYCLQKDAPFTELMTWIDKDLESEDQYLEELWDFILNVLPTEMEYYFSTDDVMRHDNLKILNENPFLTGARLGSNVTKVRNIYSRYLDRKSAMIINLLLTGRLSINRDFKEHLHAYLIARDRSNLPSQGSLALSLKPLVKNDFLALSDSILKYKVFLLEYFEVYSLQKLQYIYDTINESNIEENNNQSKSTVIYSKFTQTQLGMLTTVLSEAHHSKLGFTNLKKSQLDQLIFEFVHSKNGPIKNPRALSSRGYFGEETSDKDIQVIEDYFNNLLDTLKKLSKK